MACILFCTTKFTAQVWCDHLSIMFSWIWSGWWDGSPGMAGGNVTVSHISCCTVHFVVQNKMQVTVRRSRIGPLRCLNSKAFWKDFMNLKRLLNSKSLLKRLYESKKDLKIQKAFWKDFMILKRILNSKSLLKRLYHFKKDFKFKKPFEKTLWF